MKAVVAWKRLACFFGFSLLAVSQLQAGPMDIGGQFEVTPTGAANYTIPLVIPPGTAGIEPKLSLIYNSQTGNGLLGMGWSLSGLSAITRCPRTIAQDDARGGINFDANDRYCLDGQRLMVVSGTYGADGAEYRTERDSFGKIVGYGSAGNGPAWFKVWTKAGQVIEYGNTADSRIEAQGKSSVRIWAMNKLSDTKGNYLTASYTEDNANGNYAPNRIDYTGNAGASLSPNKSVQFVYETRPDIVPLYLAGSLIKNTLRLTKVRIYSGAIQNREYSLAYGVGATTNRSRITSVIDCALPGNECKPALSLSWSEYGSNAFNAGGLWAPFLTERIGDINGDGKSDLVENYGNSVVLGMRATVSSDGSGGASSVWVNGCSYCTGTLGYLPWLVDMNGDGNDDLVSIMFYANGVSGPYTGVWVFPSTGAGFDGAAIYSGSMYGDYSGLGLISSNRWSNDFHWINRDSYPAALSDLNGDGRPDVVGFKNDGVYVVLNTGSSFSATSMWSNAFGTATSPAYSTADVAPRLVQDVNGDGLPDIVGFASGGVYVALGTGSGFGIPSLWLPDFGVGNGWSSQSTYPRFLADLNGDGLPEIVGFKNDGTYVSINTGIGFLAASKWIADFGTATGTAYATQGDYPRYLTDVNGDGMADIVGFSAAGVRVSLSTGTGFSASTQWVADFGSNAGYSATYPRQLADVDGDGFPDIVGVLSNGTYVARSARTLPPDLVTTITNGLGAAISLNYEPLTDASIYKKGVGATFPQTDIIAPLYVLSSVRLPNGLGSGYMTQNYRYGALRSDSTGRGLLGYGWVQTTQADTGQATRTYFRQDWPYTGLPWRVEQLLPGQGVNGILRLTTTSYDCLTPQTGGPCSVAAGKRYFPYVNQSQASGWDVNGATLPMTTTMSTFDSYGNATQITVATNDGFSKSTSNTYSNDTTNWFLGRLTRSQVTAIGGGATGGGSSTSFTFNQTLSGTLWNYNLKTAAIAAGWDQVVPIVATITVANGAVIGSGSTAMPAFDTGSGFPAGSAFTLINNGYIVGAGGAGGKGGDADWNYGANVGQPGSPGGNAAAVNVGISINNANG